MKFSLRTHFALLAMIAACMPAFAQNQPSLDEQKGFTEVETFQGTFNSQSNLMKIDSTVGYDFNKNFSLFAGVPFYYANIKSSTTTTGGTTTTTPSSTSNGLGNAYVGMAFRASNSTLDYAGAITAGAPTGSTKNGFSTGRASIDWTNRFSHSFHRFTPFFVGGVANTVPDSTFFTRPFTSLGPISHLEEGADFMMVKHVYVGGSAYQIVPFGTQKVFSRVKDGGGTGTNGNETTGNDLTRENGFSGWVSFQPSQYWEAELGFTRSATFDLNSFAVNLRFNVGKMLRSRKSS